MNLSVTLQTAFFPGHLLWFKVKQLKYNYLPNSQLFSSFIIIASFYAHVVTIQANYMLAMGPLMTAIMVWKNSLVFHSLDKLTSMYDIIYTMLMLKHICSRFVERQCRTVEIKLHHKHVLPGSSMPSPPWQCISSAGVSSRTSTSGEWTTMKWPSFNSLNTLLVMDAMVVAEHLLQSWWPHLTLLMQINIRQSKNWLCEFVL